MPEFIARSFLFLLRIPVPRFKADFNPDNGDVLVHNHDFMVRNDIKVIFSTDSAEVESHLLRLGGEKVDVKTDWNSARYIRFSIRQLYEILNGTHGRLGLISDLGFLTQQLIYQYVERRIAF
jgi:hypothetical protein